MVMLLEIGDRVLGKDGRGDVVEMLVEDLGNNLAGDPVVTCVWPIYENGDQPLYRRSFARADLEPVGRTFPVEPPPLEPEAIPSRRPPAPEDMRVLVGLVAPPGARAPLVYMTREEARDYFGGELMIWPKSDEPPADIRIMPRATPQLSPEALDQMERAWTPAQVRALIADYRKLAGYP